MFTFLLWCILFVLCWPLAIVALFMYPIVWLIRCRSGSWGSRWAERCIWCGRS